MITLSKPYPSDVLSETQLDLLATQLPAPHAGTGRPAYTNRELLPGILRVLRGGMRWRDLTLPGYPDGVTHWRRLRFWMKRKGYIRVWRVLLRLLYKQKHYKKELLSLDGSVIESFAFKDTTGYSGYKHKMGTKISTVANKTGIPLAVVIAKGNIVDISLAAPTLAQIQLPRSYIRGGELLADAGYDSRIFRQTVVHYTLVPFIPRRKRGKIKQKYQLLYLTNIPLQKKRFVIERTNAWLKNFRRLRMRFDYTLLSFIAFVYLAILVICVRRLIE